MDLVVAAIYLAYYESKVNHITETQFLRVKKLLVFRGASSIIDIKYKSATPMKLSRSTTPGS
jgi:hypothetical protein